MISVNARVLASTNRRLEESVAKGEFREDLYFRLNVITIDIPPLRERREDIPLLCSHFVDKYREKYKSSVQQLPKDLMETFMSFDWPGNIRQLENTIKRYLILPDSDMTFPASKTEVAAPNAPATHQPMFLKEVGAHAAEQAERELVLRTLEQTNWNRKHAARLLNISYKALRNKLKRWNLQGRATNVVLNNETQPSTR